MGQFQVELPVDVVVTLSTFPGPYRTAYKDVPASEVFPTPYTDDFEGTAKLDITYPNNQAN